MTPDPKEPTRAKADLAPVSANEPQRSPIQSLASKIAARIHDEANVFNRNNELYYRNDIAFEIIAEELHRCGKFVESAKPKPVVTLNVSPDASPETIEALGKMAEAAVAQMAAEPTPQRSAEVQAAMDWALPHEEWGKLSAKRMEQTAKIVEYNSANAARILRAEVLRLEGLANVRQAKLVAERDLNRKVGETLVARNEEIAGLQSRAELAERALESAGFKRCDGPAAWKPPVNIKMRELFEKLYEVESERDKLRETLVAIKAVNVDEHGQVGDEAINRLIDTCPAPATTPKGATQP